MGRCRKKIMAAIEAEYEEPFWDVVQGFAAMGYSQRSTAAALGIASDFLRRLIRDSDVEIQWPAFIDGVTRQQWRDNVRQPGTAEYSAMDRSRDAQRTFIEYQGRRQSLTQWAAEKGINKYTLHKRLKAGWPIPLALETRPGAACWRSRSHKPPGQDHPWNFRFKRAGEGRMPENIFHLEKTP